MEADCTTISDRDFFKFQKLIYDLAGISLPISKKTMLCGRLAKRLRARDLTSYGEYFRLITGAPANNELQTAVNLLTTNETYFFRESAHFDYLQRHILAERQRGQTFNVWSAACSTGEEPYTLAMVLTDQIGANGSWNILGSDINTEVLAKAAVGKYPMMRGEHIPRHYLQNYCLRGIGPNEGTFLVAPELRKRVSFRQINLTETLPQIGLFDVVFLRNVLIYFDMDTKREVIGRLSHQLKPGGHLIVGHSESLNGIVNDLEMVAPTVYRRRAA